MSKGKHKWLQRRSTSGAEKQEEKSLRIRFLYSEDCPSHDEALERLRRCVAAEGADAVVEIVKVETEEEAKRLKFIGSPTIIVDGHDIDQVATPYYALTCRAYRLEDGRISPLPSEAMIRRALRGAKAKKS
jgi:hypothetical protein